MYILKVKFLLLCLFLFFFWMGVDSHFTVNMEDTELNGLLELLLETYMNQQNANRIGYREMYKSKEIDEIM